MTDHPLSSPLNYVIPPQIFRTPPPGAMNKKCERAQSNKYVCHARLFAIGSYYITGDERG